MTTWYVSPTGSASGDGSIDNPYDLATVIGVVAAGDVVYLRGGTYTSSTKGVVGADAVDGSNFAGKGVWRFTCLGTAADRITFKSYPGEWAILNGAPHIHTSGGYITFRNLEIKSTPTTRSFANKAAVDFPSMYITRPGCSIINCYIHDLSEVDIFGAGGCTTHGNIIGLNGWYTIDTGTNRAYGLYSHNDTGGAFAIEKNVFLPSLGIYAAHLYSALNDVKDYSLRYNVALNGALLMNSEVGEMSNDVMSYNYIYGNSTLLGYVMRIMSNDGNANTVAAEAKYNYIVCENGCGVPLEIRNIRTLDLQYNTMVRVGTARVVNYDRASNMISEVFDYNTYYTSGAPWNTWYWWPTTTALDYADWLTTSGFDVNSTRTDPTLPTTNHVVVIDNDYEDGRGFVVIYNYEALATVSVDISNIGLIDGAHYRLRNALNHDEYYDFIYHASSPTITISMAAADWSQRSPTAYDSPIAWYSEPFPTFGVFLIEPIESAPIGAALFDITLELSKVLQNTVEAVATGGTSTTLVDSRRREAQDYFRSGTLWFKGLKTSVEIDDWLPGTFTHGASVLSAAKDLYAAAGQDYPRWLLIQKINEALQEMLLASENVSLTSVAYQERYPLPDGVYNLKRVEVAEESTDPFGYTPNMNWQEVGGELVFDAWHPPVENDLTIRITYQPRHTQLTEDADTIPDRIPLMHLVWRAAALALRWRQGRIRMDDPEQLRQYNDAIVNAERKAGLWPVPTTPRDPHLATW